jgi:polyisoprenoid-binding protein YceI
VRYFISAVIFTLITSLLNPAFANNIASNWQLVPSDSHITFTATQNNAPVTGEFRSFTGESNFNPANLNKSNVRIVIDINSVSTSYKDIEDTLKTADWFNVKLFPQAVFTANSFTKTGGNTYQANGSLTIRDKTVPTVLTFTIQQNDNHKIIATGTTTLKRSTFDVGQGEWASTDSIKDDVLVQFKITAINQ